MTLSYDVLSYLDMTSVSDAEGPSDTILIL